MPGGAGWVDDYVAASQRRSGSLTHNASTIGMFSTMRLCTRIASTARCPSLLYCISFNQALVFPSQSVSRPPECRREPRYAFLYKRISSLASRYDDVGAGVMVLVYLCKINCNYHTGYARCASPKNQPGRLRRSARCCACQFSSVSVRLLASGHHIFPARRRRTGGPQPQKTSRRHNLHRKMFHAQFRTVLPPLCARV